MGALVVVDRIGDLARGAVALVRDAELFGDGEGWNRGQRLFGALDGAAVDRPNDIARSQIDALPQRVVRTKLHDAPAAELAAGKNRLELDARQEIAEAARQRGDDVSPPEPTGASGRRDIRRRGRFRSASGFGGRRTSSACSDKGDDEERARVHDR